MRPPQPSEAIGAYRVVEGWVRGWDVPANVDKTKLPAVSGAMIILRLHGEVIGRGSEFIETPGADPIITAAQVAIAEADRRLPLENDALRDEAAQRLAKDMTISLELAGSLIPLAGRTFENAGWELSPGIDGVAARVGARSLCIFPSTMMMQSLSARMALSSAAAQAANNPTLGLTEMEKLIDEHGVKFYRFRAAHLAQGAPGAAPSFLYRGSRVVGIGEVTSDEIRAMADRIAEHLLTRAWAGPESYGMTGTYDPCRDVSEPRIALPVEQLTTCLALVRYAKVAGIGSARSAEMVGFVDRVMSAVAKVQDGEPDAGADPTAAAAWVVALGERRSLGAAGDSGGPGTALTDFDARCRRTLLGSFLINEGFTPSVPGPAQPLVALALVRMAAEEKGGRLREEAIMLADAACRRVLGEAGAGDLVGRMPWLGWAEVELSALKNEKELASRAALRQMRTLVWEHSVSGTSQAVSDSRGGGPDMIGGVVFDAGAAARGGVVLPTWQTSRPMAFLAGMLADERLTTADERPLELARLVGALRFLRQLQADDGTAWMMQNQRKSLGGIRAAPWDQRMSADASALTLITLCEAARALGELAGPARER